MNFCAKKIKHLIRGCKICWVLTPQYYNVFIQFLQMKKTIVLSIDTDRFGLFRTIQYYDNTTP